MTPDLVREIVSKINRADQPYAAYRLRYKNMYLGKWIKHASGYPVWIIRLVRPELVSYEVRETNVHPIVEGDIGQLEGHFIHYSFNSGLRRWFHKHNFYSTREAIEGVKVRAEGLPPLQRLRAADPITRRRALKNFSYRLSARAVWRFLDTYLLRGGWLDGSAGFHYTLMISMYEYWIELKIRELEMKWQQRTDVTVQKLLGEDNGANGKFNGNKPKVDILIPTYNEAAHIKEVVANAGKLGPVFVLDSFSTDGTQQLAREAGATVVEHEFKNYSDQKNWGLDNLPLTGEWVFILDADERITPELREEVIRELSKGSGIDGYFVNRLLIFMGRPVRHGGLYPSWNLRLFRRGKARYERRAVHEHMICSGPVAYLKKEMLHIRRESMAQYIEKHIAYADMESDEWVRWRRGEGSGAEPSVLFRHVLKWRQWIRREVWPRVPGRPIWRFFYMYFARGGFLDARAGWHLAWLMASYEYMISLMYVDKMLSDVQRGGVALPMRAVDVFPIATPVAAS
jgi:glycosyltransferase involved in cell wall biosynthesis